MSSQETVSGAISDRAATQFSLTFSESTGAVCTEDSLTFSKWAASQFSLTFSESTGAVRGEDSFCDLWKQFS